MGNYFRMVYARTEGRYVSRATWFSLSCSAAQAVTTLALLALAVSLAAASVGAPDGVMVVALAAITTVALGLALVRLFAYLETNGLPLLEEGHASTT